LKEVYQLPAACQTSAHGYQVPIFNAARPRSILYHPSFSPPSSPLRLL